MVVDNLDVLNSCRSPTKADPVLVVDPNRVLTGSVASQFLESEPWQGQGVQGHGRVKLIQHPAGALVELAGQRLAGHLGVNSVVDILGTAIPEREDQVVEFPGAEC